MMYFIVFLSSLMIAAFFFRVVDDDEDEDKLVPNVKCHYSQAKMSKIVFDLGDCAYVKVSFSLIISLEEFSRQFYSYKF